MINLSRLPAFVLPALLACTSLVASAQSARTTADSGSLASATRTSSRPDAPRQVWQQVEGDPIPLIYTNQLLQAERNSIPDLAVVWQRRFAGRGCVSVNVVLGGQRIDELQVAAYVRKANALLAESLDVTGLTEFVVRSAVGTEGLPPGTVPEGRRAGLRFHARGYRYKGEKVTPLGQTEPSITLQVVSGDMGRSAGVYLSDRDEILLLLGEGIIEEGNLNYFLHLVGNLVGVPPIWGNDQDDCDDDGFADTPQHAAANYDCAPDHYSICSGARESDDNYMDARYCPGRRARWSGEQAAVLLSGLTASKPCPQPTGEESGDLKLCGFGVTPNPLRGGGSDCTLRFATEEVTKGAELRVSLRQGSSVLHTERVELIGGIGAGSVDLCGLNLAPGYCTVSVEWDGKICSGLIVVGSK